MEKEIEIVRNRESEYDVKGEKNLIEKEMK
jgi:hypothetical protein